MYVSSRVDVAMSRLHSTYFHQLRRHVWGVEHDLRQAQRGVSSVDRGAHQLHPALSLWKCVQTQAHLLKHQTENFQCDISCFYRKSIQVLQKSEELRPGEK